VNLDPRHIQALLQTAAGTGTTLREHDHPAAGRKTRETPRRRSAGSGAGRSKNTRRR